MDANDDLANESPIIKDLNREIERLKISIAGKEAIIENHLFQWKVEHKEKLAYLSYASSLEKQSYELAMAKDKLNSQFILALATLKEISVWAEANNVIGGVIDAPEVYATIQKTIENIEAVK